MDYKVEGGWLLGTFKPGSLGTSVVVCREKNCKYGGQKIVSVSNNSSATIKGRQWASIVQLLQLNIFAKLSLYFPASFLAMLFILWLKLLYTILFLNDNTLQLLLKGYFLAILNSLTSVMRSPLAKTTVLRWKGARRIWYTFEDLETFFTGAQPKAGTGHKMQSISVVFSTLHCEGYIADLRYRWLITSGSARWPAH